MSRKNGKSRGRRDGDTSGESSPENTTPSGEKSEKTPRKKLTVPERLLAKSRLAYEAVKSVLDAVAFHGAPANVVETAQTMEIGVKEWMDGIRVLAESGWQPVAKTRMKDLAEGDLIVVTKEAADLYSYIPADVMLAAGKIERSENGRLKRIMLRDARIFAAEGCPEGQPSTFGWAQVSHLERR